MESRWIRPATPIHPIFRCISALRATPAGGGDGFVAKLNPGGDGLSYATYLGGRQADTPKAVAVDASGNAYVTGSTFSSDFPVTAGALQTVNRGGYDAFVAKLNPQGAYLVYSTYLGGAGSEEGSAIAVNSAGIAHIAGYTDSSQFPLLQPVEPAPKGGRDAFAAAVAENGAALSWSTYLGGAGEDRATAIAVDAAGSAYVAGFTFSPDFRTTAGAYRTSYASGEAFLLKLGAGQQPPVVVGVSPASGSGVNATLAFQYSDPNGAADLAWARAWIGSTPANACYVVYHRPSNDWTMPARDGLRRSRRAARDRSKTLSASLTAAARRRQLPATSSR
jgi:hypothetical protein